MIGEHRRDDSVAPACARVIARTPTTMVATRPQSDAHSVLPQVATRRLETRGGSSVMTVAAVTPPAPVTPSEKLCTGKTAPCSRGGH